MNTDVTNKNTALQERTEIFKPSQKHGVEVWDYGLSGQLEKKKTRAVTGRGWVWQARFASGRCGAGGSGFVLAASSRFVGLSCLLRELLWETCKVKGLLVKRAGKWIQTESLTPVLVAAGSSPQLWALPGPSRRQLRSALPRASAGGLAVLRTFITRP